MQKPTKQSVLRNLIKYMWKSWTFNFP